MKTKRTLTIATPVAALAALTTQRNFITAENQVRLWGPSVIEFINRYPLP
jgi:hypothetical protein